MPQKKEAATATLSYLEHLDVSRGVVPPGGTPTLVHIPTPVVTGGRGCAVSTHVGSRSSAERRRIAARGGCATSGGRGVVPGLIPTIPIVCRPLSRI